MATSDGLRQASSLCLDVEFLKFGESCGEYYSHANTERSLFNGERVETRREGRKTR